MFNTYVSLLATAFIAFIFLLKIFYPYIVDQSYQEGIIYIFPLGFSAVLFALVYFFDMGYQCAKDTSRTLPAIIVASIVNVTLNYILVPIFGVFGAIATSITTYLLLVIYRYYDMRRYFKLSLYRSMIIAVAVMLLSAIPFYTLSKWYVLLMLMIAGCTIAILTIPKSVRDEFLFMIREKTRNIR